MSCARQDFWTTWKASSKLLSEVKRKDDPADSDNEEPCDYDRTAVPAAQYHYTDLTSANTHIRLLELQAGHGHDLIICKLHETGIDTNTDQYEALSYVWGPPSENTFPIQVHECTMRIGSSLHDALKDLRHADRPRLLWIDAICINQSNISERNIQVPLMCEIYQNASCTICYLGPKGKTTRAVYTMLEELAEEAKALEVKSTASNTIDTLPAVINHLPVEPVKSKLYEKYVGDSTIVTMAGCEWWHRAWTVQEIMLSSKAVVMTGRYTITWDAACAAVDHGLNTQMWGPVVFGFVMNPVVVPYLSMRALMSRYRYPHRRGSPAADLLHLLTHCRHRDSTDPRDKIYAILGLFRKMHPEALRSEGSNALVELSYDYDVVFVFRKMTQELIQRLGNLDVLGIRPKTNLKGLPSWATDWSVTDKIGSPLMQDSLDRIRTTHAAKHTKADALFPDDGNRMIVRGHVLTSVVTLEKTFLTPSFHSASVYYQRPNNSTELLARFPDYARLVPDYDAIPAKTGLLGFSRLLFSVFTAMFKSFYEIFLQFLHDEDVINLMSTFNTLFAWEHFAAAQSPMNPGGRPESVYWQTLCAGTYKNGSVEDTEYLFKTWSKLLQPLRKFMKNHPKSIEQYPMAGVAVYMKANWQGYGEFWPYIACSQHRRLGRAANGWLCLLPEGTMLGDVIILAKGGRVPLVMRVDGSGQYTYIGEAYVHGIMDGEAFDEGLCVDIKVL